MRAHCAKSKLDLGPRVGFYGLGLVFGSNSLGNGGLSGSGVQNGPRIKVNVNFDHFSHF